MSICEVCGKEFVQRRKSPSNHTKTCSRECRYKLSAQNTRESSGRWTMSTCPRCGTEFKNQTNTKAKTYCTWDCMMEARTEDARASRTCEVCGQEFTYFKRQDQRTCSPACRNKLTAKKREINYPECKVCGISTGSYNRIYCDEHRPSRPGRKPRPRRTATCHGCGEEFSRPGTWPGQMMFCSLKCSNENHSSQRARHYRHGDWSLNGSYELRLAACLDRLLINWERWPGNDPFVYQTPDGQQHEYRPDFLVEGSIVVEVKGWEENPDSTQRHAHVQWDRPEPLVLVDREKLASLERIFSRQQFLEALTAGTSPPCRSRPDHPE